MKVFNLKFLILTSIIFLIQIFDVNSQTISNQVFEIIELQDKRSLSINDKLKTYLHSLDSLIREKSIYALANIGDSNTVSYLDFLFAGPFSDYPKKSDIKAAAFMLGQINCDASRNMLSTILKNRSNYENEMLESGKYVIEAVGKIGNENSLQELIQREDLIYSSDEQTRSAAAMAIAGFALRRISNEMSVEFLKKIVSNSSDTITLRNAAYAFWRTGDKNLLLNARQEIYDLVESKDAQTRMWAYNALGKLKDNLLLLYTLESFTSEIDWRVKVNMLNSLRNYNIDSTAELFPQIITTLGTAMDDINPNVSLTAVTVTGQLFKDIKNSKNETATALSELMKDELINAMNTEDSLSSVQRTEIANTLSLMYRDEIKDDLFKTFYETNDYDLKGGVVRAFGNFDDYKIYDEVRDSVSAEVKRYNDRNNITMGDMISGKELAKIYRGFVEMLSAQMSKTKGEDRNLFRLMFTEFVGSKDPVITEICLTALKDTIFSEYKDETASIILFDYNELEYPQDEAVIMVFIDAMKDLNNKNTIEVLEKNLSYGNYDIAKASADALEKIKFKRYPVHFTQRSDLDKAYLELMDGKKNIVIKTNKGNIRIELFPDAAPLTVLNFLKLSEKNYFDGTIFHRVVPNFVIQGGDPTGTGYGGPGYSIRSEFSPVDFGTGYLGMASSGKDTESSQFFITHSATPHLDGRYTVFGKVTEGLDVVDIIMIGDVVEDVVVE